jgi:Ala-tRNA(Pro) deacylase
MKCRERLEQYLRENHADFEVMTHSEVFTMQEVAAALHVPGDHVAKVVIVNADGAMAMLVLPASYRLAFSQVRSLLGTRDARLASEEEFTGLFPDCDTGAMPPFGNLYDVPVHVDRSLADQTNILFRVGTHTETMKLAYSDFARLAQPIAGSFAEEA